MFKVIRALLFRPLLVVVVLLLATCVIAAEPVDGVPPQEIIAPKVLGTNYAKVTITTRQESADGARFHIRVPQTTNSVLNVDMNSFINQEVATFKGALTPLDPHMEGFAHQLRIEPHLHYASDNAFSVTLQVDTYHPVKDVYTTYVSWIADASGVRKTTLSEHDIREVAQAIGVNSLAKQKVMQAVSFGILPNYKLRLYRSGMLYEHLQSDYKDISLNQLPSLASTYGTVFFPTYTHTRHPKVQSGLAKQYARALTKISPQQIDCTVLSCVALTFDDGPDTTTNRVLDVLQAHNTKATFFMLGKQVRDHPDIAKSVVAHGHEVENHSYDHPDFAKIRQPKQMHQQIDDTQHALAEIGAVAKYFRPPYGSISPKVHDAVPMPFVFWNVDAQEWRSGNGEAPKVSQSIMAQVRPGAIILMHDTKAQTADALPAILQGLAARGYVCVTVQDLLKIDGAARGEFKTGL